MGDPWDTHALPMEYQWTAHEQPIGFIRRLHTGNPCATYGQLIGNPCPTHGQHMATNELPTGHP